MGVNEGTGFPPVPHAIVAEDTADGSSTSLNAPVALRVAVHDPAVADTEKPSAGPAEPASPVADDAAAVEPVASVAKVATAAETQAPRGRRVMGDDPRRSTSPPLPLTLQAQEVTIDLVVKACE